MELRSNKGGLWENFLVVERLKQLHAQGARPNRYFWRTQRHVEIDYVEEQDGLLSAFEFKWGDKPAKAPSAFVNAYPQSRFRVVNRENFEAFVGA